jgi:hypothetical protein
MPGFTLDPPPAIDMAEARSHRTRRIRVPKGTLPLIPAAEDRNLDRLAVIAQLLDAPIAGALAIAKHFGAKIVRACAAHWSILHSR